MKLKPLNCVACGAPMDNFRECEYCKTHYEPEVEIKSPYDLMFWGNGDIVVCSTAAPEYGYELDLDK